MFEFFQLRFQRRYFKLLVCISLSGVSSAFAVETELKATPHYQWGRGLEIPALNVNLGGYLSTSVKQPLAQPLIAAVDDLSLFINWSPYDRLHLFSEVELEDWLTTDHLASLGKALRIERLYADWLVSDRLKLRLGKFLTPFGIWNLIHAAPLVWTSTRPLVTEEHLFPSHVSGLMLNHSLNIDEHTFDIAVYVDDSPLLDPREDRLDFDHAFGIRLNYEFSSHLQFSSSYLTFKNRATAQFSRHYLIGIDGLWKKNDYELQGEFSYRFASDHQRQEKNLYLQAVVPIVPTFFAIGRYEYSAGWHLLEDDFKQTRLHLAIGGMAWRPYTPLVLKAEYRFSSQAQTIAPSGFFASISMFF
jgi:hypothetical protein